MTGGALHADPLQASWTGCRWAEQTPTVAHELQSPGLGTSLPVASLEGWDLWPTIRNTWAP